MLLSAGLLGSCSSRSIELLRPNGIAVAADGSLYVMDRGNYRVVHLTQDGEWLSTFGGLGTGPNNIYAGWDIELDSAGNIYICNLVTAEEGLFRAHEGVKVFSPNGQFVRELGGQDYNYTNNTQAHTSYGLDIDAQGRVYVAGYDSNILRVFDPAGPLLDEFFGEKGAGAGQFNGMTDVAVDDERRLLYFTDQFNSRVQQFEIEETATGEMSLKHRLTFGGYGREPGEFAYPQNIVVDDRSGQVYVSDMANRRIQVFDVEGRYLTELSVSGNWQVMGLDLDQDGTLYAIDALNNLIWVFEPGGQPRRLEVKL
jgi:DNA-binding beta-propeller fold protein YncE